MTNVVIVHWHDVGRHLGAYGAASAPSPVVDRLAGDGIRFDRAYATAPLCSPSRGSIFTGLHPQAHGLLGLAHHGWRYADGVRTLPVLLAPHGWRTALAGMQHESTDARTLGFGELLAQDCGSRCDPVADAAAAWLRDAARRTTPFLLSVGFNEVHRPYDEYPPDDPAAVDVPPYLPDNPWTRADLAAFQGAIRRADAATGRVLDTLDVTGLADDTWVIVTTDHGIAFPRAKSTLYDTGIGVALVMRPPRTWPAARAATERLYSHVDLVPTVLDALGLPVPGGLHGVSHAPLLHGRDVPPPRDAVFAGKTYHDVYDPMRCIRTDRHALIRSFEERPVLTLPLDVAASPTARGYGSEWLRHRPPVELYDLADDPSEEHDRADDPALASVRDDLVERLTRWQLDTADPLLDGPVPRPAPRDG
ncbi:MAG: sulfatase [Acidothermales bacterium]|nr:sulfatase [Acidothermales bacterium]